MEPIEQLSYLLPTVSDLVDCTKASQLDNATPCEWFTVHDVLDHMLVLGGSFVYVFRGEEPPEIQPSSRDGTVPVAAFRTTMNDLFEAVRSPGALERTVSSPVGAMRGERFARLVAFDGLVHGWDLAVATGQDYQPPAALVAAVDEFARVAITDEMRDGDTFKAPITASADSGVLEQLVAFSGRTL